ncbi:MAG TPA: hypothetical protein VHP33_07785 [Polyangiaceae bacterium]|nr:hypothetical protein [Polyangiaceae bacterium]
MNPELSSLQFYVRITPQDGERAVLRPPLATVGVQVQPSGVQGAQPASGSATTRVRRKPVRPTQPRAMAARLKSKGERRVATMEVAVASWAVEHRPAPCTERWRWRWA